MLSHFRLFPIPLECGAAGALSGALLVPFSLHRWSSEPSVAHCSRAPPRSSCLAGTGTAPGSASQPGSRRAPDPPPPAAAPLRRSESMGRRPLSPRHPAAHIAQRDSDYELEPDRGRKRAIDNQYMLL
ncbi:hypothetical protein EYF80_030656 [Liparis tanakae]|uniref:Uncharacterized protein n=1 Tax=Liparis tanakae TaxID=230148 RepID=A0A4Z2H2M9_9TELE|nr:hypothetical protein EYF80_030656 [Liparis tanakae]